jgi:hypothetical protein
MPRLETRDRPAPGGPSAFGGTRKGAASSLGPVGVPGPSPMPACRDYSPDRDKYVRMVASALTSGGSLIPEREAKGLLGSSWARPRFVCSNAGFECCLKSRELGSGLRTLPAPTVMLKRQTADFKLRIRFLIRTHSRQRFSQPAMSFCDARPTQSSFDGSAARSCSSSTRLAAILTIFSTRGDLRAAAAKYALDQVRAKFGRSTPEKQRHGLNGKAWCS